MQIDITEKQLKPKNQPDWELNPGLLHHMHKFCKGKCGSGGARLTANAKAGAAVGFKGHVQVLSLARKLDLR